MKKNLLFTCFLFPALYTHSQDLNQAPTSGRRLELQLDFNFVAVGLRSVYHFNPQTNVYISGGYGWATVLLINEHQYIDPVKGKGSDIVMPTFICAPYYSVGIQQFLMKPKSLHTKVRPYVKGELKHYFPSTVSQPHRNLYSHQFRTAVRGGVQSYLNHKQNWLIGFELGAALWSNFNWSYINGGPQINLNVAGRLW